MATTPNFSWPLPDETDVPDVPADMASLGDGIDTSVYTMRYDSGIATNLYTDANGLMTVPHNLGTVPVFAIAMINGTSTYTSLVPAVSTFTSTDFGTTIYNLTARAVQASAGPFSVRYVALAAGIGDVLSLSNVEEMRAALAEAEKTKTYT